MGRPKKTSILSEFERTGEPNIQELAALTDKARGGRTVTEFAAQCGVNASTMSRIINGKISSPISDELLVAIAANADPGSEVTFEALLNAHGVKLPEGGRLTVMHDLQHLLLHKIADLGATTDAQGKTSFAGRGESRMEQNAREIIQNDLLTKGFKVSVEREVDLLDGVMFPYTADFVIETDALERDGLVRWAFDVVGNPTRHIVSHLDRIFSSAYLDSPSEKGLKVTIVTFDKPSFYTLMEELKGKTVPDCVSVMMLNAKNRCVQYEFISEWAGHPNLMKLYPDGSEIDPQDIYGVPDENG